MATTAAQDRLRKPLAFETVDPRGNIVICSQSVWDNHIEKDHPEMQGRLADVKAAVANPDGIRESTARPGSAQVYEYVALDSVQIRAVLTFDDPPLIASGTTIAKVNTAFPVNPEDYDKPQVGHFVFKRSDASNVGGGGDK